MKTNHFIKSGIILLVMSCVTSFSASAHRHPATARAKRSNHAKIPSSALATMKLKSIRFGFNNYNVPADYYTNLDKVIKLMKENNASVKVSGYADKKGGYVYNWKLSEKRAQAVKVYMIDKGADSTRIATTGFGYTHPVASNATPEGRAKNRRAEVHFVE